MNCTPNELAVRLSYAEFVELLADYGIEPWGEGRADLRAALIASVMANCMSTKSHKIEEFILRWDDNKTDNSKQIMAMFRGMAERGDGRNDSKR